jgi:divalent metal cation (Fe/Co/Zn/Cd) transporter
MWTSFAVVLGVGCVWLTGILWIDPVIAIAAGLNIGVSAVSLMRRSFGGLLDTAEAKDTPLILRRLDQAVDEGVITSHHHLRHRTSDDVMWIEVHMLVPGEITMDQAHQRITSVEEAIAALFPDRTVHLTTHIEPQAHDLHHPEGHPELHDPFRQARP